MCKANKSELHFSVSPETSTLKKEVGFKYHHSRDSNWTIVRMLAFLLMIISATHIEAQSRKKTTPIITWNPPVGIIYGTALTSVQLNATANVTGTFIYTPKAGIVLNAGQYSLKADFSPSSPSKYNSASATVPFTVNKATATITLSNLNQTYDGSPKPVTVVTSPVGLAVDITYNGLTTAPTNPGSYNVVATISNQNYNGNASGTLNIINSQTTDKVKIVVLGSSTAQGTGASTYSKSWVGLLTTSLNTDYPNRTTVTNLASGGFTTYQILPTGTNNGSNRPAVDASHNITAALALNPQIILINMPTNDVANGYSSTETLNNFATVINTARAANVKVILTGTQPRGDITLSSRQLLQSENQSLLTIFGSDCVNIYDELTDFSNYGIKAMYSFGDNIHVNDAGHLYIYSQMLPPVKAWIDARSINQPIMSSVQSAKRSVNGLQNSEVSETTGLSLSTWPNPFSDHMIIHFQTKNNTKVNMALYDLRGALIRQVYNGNVVTGSEISIELSGKELASGVYLLRLNISPGITHARLVVIQ